jgi:hypothetical protein
VKSLHGGWFLQVARRSIDYRYLRTLRLGLGTRADASTQWNSLAEFASLAPGE